MLFYDYIYYGLEPRAVEACGGRDWQSCGLKEQDTGTLEYVGEFKGVHLWYCDNMEAYYFSPTREPATKSELANMYGLEWVDHFDNFITNLAAL